MHGNVAMNIRGIEIMKGKAEKARVVHASIESEALQQIADGIANAFIDAGWSLQLHLNQTKRPLTKYLI